MLTIREEQLSALAAPHRGRFVQDLVDFLRREIPAACAAFPDNLLSARVDGIVELGLAHGIELRQDLARLALWLMAAQSDSAPWVSEILAYRAPAYDRLEWLRQRACAELGEEAP